MMSASQPHAPNSPFPETCLRSSWDFSLYVRLFLIVLYPRAAACWLTLPSCPSMKPLLSSPVHSFFVCVTRRRGSPRPRPSALPSRFCHPDTAVALVLFPGHPSPSSRRRDQEQGHAHPSWLCPVCEAMCDDCVANLVASCRVKTVLNDLLSVRARTGARYPLLRTPKDVPAKPCPESTHLTRGSPEGTPGCQSGDSDQGARQFHLACVGSPLCRLHPSWHPPSASHLHPPRDGLGPLRERSRLQVLP